MFLIAKSFVYCYRILMSTICKNQVHYSNRKARVGNAHVSFLARKHLQI